MLQDGRAEGAADPGGAGRRAPPEPLRDLPREPLHARGAGQILPPRLLQVTYILYSS